MKGFQFRLARLKRLREIEETTARERFLAADRAARDAEEFVALARTAVLDAEETLRTTQSSTRFSAETVLTSLTASDALRARVLVPVERASVVSAAAEGQRQAVSELRA